MGVHPGFLPRRPSLISILHHAPDGIRWGKDNKQM
jgi:hypothetical protein